MTTPTSPDPNSGRPSAQVPQLNIVRALAGLVSQFIVGLLGIAGGGALVKFSLAKEPHNSTLLWTGIGVAVGGALCLPSILEIAGRISDKFFPNGIPLPFFSKKTPPAQ